MRSFAAMFLASHMGYVGIFYASPIAWISAASVVFIGYVVTIRKLGKRKCKLAVKWHHQRMLQTPQEANPEGTPAE